ncbi:glucose 1-dehydrogenase [Hyphomonas sp.]|jgi:NAD(P)-dependent dehydrogenase (short-subunit alcohol dehydrogenase family)|uniref:SDR family NAD(P)-dependent oxidoreductase n=2 Tax=Hyphomonas sp. TaxID=87 RepID=UPI0032972FF8
MMSTTQTGEKPDPFDRLRLDGKVAVITGGGGGIGRAIALRFAELGADIAIAEIIPERADETVARAREFGRQAIALPTDVMDTDQIRAAIERTDETFGRIDVLVNNAGGVAGKAFLDQSERSWRRHIDINFVSMLAATSAAVPVMIRGGRGGSIINITSIEGMRAAPGYAVYAACKAAMINFTESMALEFSADGIRVNAIAPDHTITPGGRGNRTGPVDPLTWLHRSDEAQDAMNRLIPLGREGLDTECGDVAAFLASPMASYMTGVTLPVDGGTMAAGGWHRDRNGRWTQIEGQGRS